MENPNVIIRDDVITKRELLEQRLDGKLLNKKSAYLYFKRAGDIFISSIGLIFLMPVFLIVALLIKIDSKGAVIFKHKRIGKNGKEIYIYKFRTMVSNAEDLINSFTKEQMQEFKENYKLTNDTRITRMGHILRNTSLDELPQIINILKGDLSIIGPRPVVSDELEKYGPNKSKFLSVVPGLTGYWQANGRSNTTYEERMQMEMYYVDNLSFKLDMKVFIKTFSAVIKRTGAM